ncbi:MAG: exonuclease SbcCD subunit D [Spirochaetales bacterium]|nr:exonuclease SbcCD subunit D [Spirochaetales bacterium]
MRSFRIAHTADWHIGASYIHGDEARQGLNTRLLDFRDAIERSCRQMVEERVNLMLFGGDGFRDSKPSPTEVAVFRSGLDILCDAGIPTVAIPGNHCLPRQIGRTHALRIFDGYRDLVTVVDHPQVLQASGLPVACFPYPSRAHLAAQDPEFEKLSLDEQNQRIVELSLKVLRKLGAEAEQMAGPLGCVLLAHGTIGGSKVGAEQSTAFLREPVLPLSEINGLPFIYQAWGHLHRAQNLDGGRFDVGRIRYSGSIERCDFAEADEDKGWWLIGLSPGPEYTVQWRSSEPRPFVDIDLGADIDQGCDELIMARVLDVSGAVVRVTYTATPEVARTVDHAAIRRALLAAGAAKIHGPFAKITHTVTEASEDLTEDTDMLTGWNQWAALQGIDGPRFDRLDATVREALEVLA